MTVNAPQAGRLPTWILMLTAAALLAGCAGDEPAADGQGTDDDLVLATVGSRTVTLGYYESKLAELKREDLPRDAAGLPIDTGSPEGRRSMLDILIINEVQSLKAVELGYDRNESYQHRANAVAEYSAGALMLDELIVGPANEVDDADVEAYYAQLQTKRKCRFLICRFRDDAVAAREALLAGELWEDVADEYHEGYRGARDDYTETFAFGRMEDSFEEAAFSLEAGEISPPVATPYGWWLLRLEEVLTAKAKPLDDVYREEVRRSIIERRTNLGRKRFIAESRERHDFTMDESALWIVFQGLPENEAETYPGTRTPVSAAELTPLDVPTRELDRAFFGFRTGRGDEVEAWSVGDYKQLFDGLNGAQRPKRSGDLMGVRSRILGDMVDRMLLIAESRERGYFERPEVSRNVRRQSDSQLIGAMLDDVVDYDEKITPEQMDAFWAEYGEMFLKPEERSGRVVYCESPEKAAEARTAAEAGTPWADVIALYEVDAANRKAAGRFRILAGRSNALASAVFALEEAGGSLSEVFPSESGFGVARLDEIQSQRQQTLDEARNIAGNRIKAMRRREALSSLMEQWRAEYVIEVDDEALARVRSWEELTGTL